MSVLEPPIERVNYFNGERLEARDFRAEQDYQVRVRRILNRSLYSAGIVRGLEVTKHPTDKHKVIVSPGLAFDAAGREIIVLEPEAVQVMGAPSTSDGVVFGNFLAICYSETRGQPVKSACHATPEPCGCDLIAAGPTRIQTYVTFEFLDSWPSEASGRIVLAQVELKAGCEVAKIHLGVRKYAVAAKPPKVRLVSIEGEKDINVQNQKTVFFHVDGGFPENVTLYLRGSQLSTLFYTELGKHTHDLDLVLSTQPAVADHDHALGELKTDECPAHSHTVTADVEDADDDGLELADNDENVNLNTTVNMALSFEGKHFHKIAPGARTEKAGGVPAHTHTPTTKVVHTAGAPTINANNGPQLTYVNALQVWYDGKEITAAILKQLGTRDPTAWPTGSTLGNGGSGHVFVTVGTKAVNLMQIVDDVGPGEHRLDFRVAAPSGGQIHYNLYVE